MSGKHNLNEMAQRLGYFENGHSVRPVMQTEHLPGPADFETRRAIGFKATNTIEARMDQGFIGENPTG